METSSASTVTRAGEASSRVSQAKRFSLACFFQAFSKLHALEAGVIELVSIALITVEVELVSIRFASA
ncbi:MAG TPA: hypothetical protein VGM01_00040 [Ktedonobacteraceae bacterium]|jgi:hypothetical protein